MVQAELLNGKYQIQLRQMKNTAQLVQQLEGGGMWYRDMQRPFYEYSSNGSDFCLKLCIANMICNCCCGGNIFCC